MKNYYKYGRTSLTLKCPDKETASWVQEFITPSFKQIEEKKTNWLISYKANKNTWLKYKNLQQETKTLELDIFSLHRSFFKLPAIIIQNNQTLFFNSDGETFIKINKKQKDVKITAKEYNNRARASIIRILREVIQNECLNLNQIPLHASAFCNNKNEGIVIFGEKNSGKTTLLTECLRDKNFKYLANDRIMLNLQGDKIIARGIPTFVGIKTDRGKISKSPALFCKELNAKKSEKMKVLAFVHLETEKSTEESQLRELEREAANRRLLENLLKGENGKLLFSEVFLDKSHEPLEENLLSDLDKLTKISPVFYFSKRGTKESSVKEILKLIKS